MACLDTSVIIGFLEGDKGIVDLIGSYRDKEGLSTTAVTVYELLKHGDKLKRDLADDLLGDLTVFNLDDTSARASAAIFAGLRDRGKLINENDILIAGIAMANGQRLVTRDRKFSAIEGGNILIV